MEELWPEMEREKHDFSRRQVIYSNSLPIERHHISKPSNLSSLLLVKKP